MNVIEDSMVFVENETQDVIIINSSARFIFNGLLEQASITHIVDKYIESNCIRRQDVDYDTVICDFSNTSNLLFEKGVLINV